MLFHQLPDRQSDSTSARCSPYVPAMTKKDMTIADLAEWFRGVPRDNLVLIKTRDGVKRMTLCEGTYVYEKDGRIIATPAQSGTRYAMLIHVED
jgi:hypothetical protein